MTNFSQSTSELHEIHLQHGLEYSDFLTRYGSVPQRAKWQRALDQLQLSDEQRNRIAPFTRQINVLCMAGTWCGDCIEQCPILVRIAQASEHVNLRFVDRDAHEELKRELLICGAPRIPQVVFFSELGDVVSRFGDRTLSKYRSLGQQMDGAGCAIGNVSASSPLTQSIITEWIDEFERVHWILRLSPGLREIHQD